MKKNYIIFIVLNNYIFHIKMDVFLNNDNIILLNNTFDNYDYDKHINNTIISHLIFNNVNKNEIICKLNEIKYKNEYMN